jgi:hypothetical protein
MTSSSPTASQISHWQERRCVVPMGIEAASSCKRNDG